MGQPRQQKLKFGLHCPAKLFLVRDQNEMPRLRLHIGIMENKMETTIVYGGSIGILEQRMETTAKRGLTF